jgi:exosortase/archaeosortase family protein
MLVTFFALATAVAIVIDRPWLDRGVIVLSAVPVALISNIVRITVTGMLFETVGSRVAHVVYHDLAGWFMMPLALLLLWMELKLLSHLLVSPPPEVSLDLGVHPNAETSPELVEDEMNVPVRR